MAQRCKYAGCKKLALGNTGKCKFHTCRCEYGKNSSNAIRSKDGEVKGQNYNGCMLHGDLRK